jgi:hypothetical protein
MYSTPPLFDGGYDALTLTLTLYLVGTESTVSLVSEITTAEHVNDTVALSSFHLLATADWSEVLLAVKTNLDAVRELLAPF